MCWGLRQKELDFVELCEILDGTLWCFVGLAISMLTSTMEIRSRSQLCKLTVIILSLSLFVLSRSTQRESQGS